jgi:hypothetical protein
MEAFDDRMNRLESLIEGQRVIVRALQSNTGDTLHVIEAIANRVRVIFWLAVAAFCLAALALLLVFR